MVSLSQVLSFGPKPELHFAETRDGWRLALYRYQPSSPKAGQSPVVLCHGLGANRFNMDAPGRYSLARAIAARGFDTWVLELRGAGQSHRRSLVPLRRRVTFDWNFDDYVHHDVPAVVAHVRRATGSESVHWVGHSMGGMVGYAFLTLADQHHIRSLVAIGSPAFSGIQSPYLDAIIPFHPLLRVVDHLPYAKAARAAAPTMAVITQFVPLFGNPDNMDPWLTYRMLRTALSDMSSGLLRQFLDWYRSQDFRGWYGTHSYKSNLRDIRVPVVVLAGSVDKLTPPHDLQYIFDQLSSVDKRFVLVGRNQGFSADYGHVDLVLGRRAPDEIFPLIADWLEGH